MLRVAYWLMFLGIAIAPLLLQAQEADFGIWSSLAINKKISTTSQLSFSQEFRSFENSTRMDKIFSQLELSFKPFKWLKTSAAYRFSQKNNFDRNLSLGHRLQADLSVFKKFYKLKLEYRARVQTQVEGYYSRIEGNIPSKVFRQKISLEYDFGRRLIPGISGEYFYDFSPVNQFEFLRDRYRGHLNYEIDRRKKVAVFYQVQQKWNSKRPVDAYAIGLELSFAI